MNYKTCASIAEKTPNNLTKQIKKGLKKSDYIEVRFDFLKPEKIPEVLEKIKKDLNRIVCTLRPKSEGGVFSGTEIERISILKLIAEYNPFLLDIEYNTLKKNNRLVKYLKGTKTNLLVSWHDFKKTPTFSKIKNQLSQMSKFSNNIKIVTTANSTNDSTTILQLYSKKGKTNLIAFAMGEVGQISRILCLHLGSPYTYVSLGKAVAPGQFSVDEVKKISKLKRS